MKEISYGYFRKGKFVNCGDKPTKTVQKKKCKIVETYPVKRVTWK